MNFKTVSLRRTALPAALLPAALLASALLAEDASADYHFQYDTTYNDYTALLSGERVFLENGAILSGGTPGAGFHGDNELSTGPRFIMESGVVDNITFSGSGNLLKTTSGTVEINSLQAYTGVTAIEEGTLLLSTDNALEASRAVLIIDNARLDIGGTSQDFQQLFIANGILDGQPGSVVSSQSEFTLENGVSMVTLADSISPDALPAFVTKQGMGTFTFQAQNTYTGGTYIMDGTLDMGGIDYAISQASNVVLNAGGTWDMSDTTQEIGSLADYWSASPHGSIVNLGLNGRLFTGFDNTNTTFTGSIIGQNGGINAVFKTGLGVWNFDGSAHDVMLFNVTEGALFINGYVNATTVGSYKTGAETPLLGGSGHIDAHHLYAIGGAIMPGSQYQPGRLTVGSLIRDGDFTMDPYSTLVIRLGPWHLYDNIVNTGHSLLEGELIVTPWYGYRPTSRRYYTILQSENGIDNQLHDVQLALPRTMLKPRLSQVDHSDGSSELRLYFDQQRFNKVRNLHRRHASIASSLDKEVRGGKINNLIDTLNQIDIDQVPNAIALLSPEQVSAVFSVGFSGARAQFSNIEGRLDTARAGVSSFSTSGLMLTDSRGSLHFDGAPIMRNDLGLSLAGYDGKSLVVKESVAPLMVENRWGFFATGTGEWSDIESTNLARGSEFTTGGVTIGADYRVSRNLIVGLAGGYANTGSDLWDGGKVTLNSGKANAYASLFNENAYLNLSAGGAYNSIETERSTLGGMARAKANGGEFNTMIGGGYDLHFDNGLTFGPIASLQYTYFNLNHYREHGSDAPLEFPTQSQNSLRSSLGLRAAYGVQWGGIVFTPEVRAQWAHEYLDSTSAVVSQFVGASSTFSVRGPEIGRDSLILDAGVSAQLNPAVGVFAYYTGEIGRTNFSSNSVNGGVRISF